MLSEYFLNTQGFGVLSTADAQGKVDAALYARPHFIDEHTVAFIMADKHSHRNVRENPHAVYLFKEDGPQYHGKRLFLTKVGESDDQNLIANLRRSKHNWPQNKACDSERRFLVQFRVDQVKPLVGDDAEM